jgi:hypothetical protein
MATFQRLRLPLLDSAIPWALHVAVHLPDPSPDSGVVSLNGTVTNSGDMNWLIAGVTQRLREFERVLEV